jgi:hypothetical protein
VALRTSQIVAGLLTPIKKQQITSMKQNLLYRMAIQKEHRGTWTWLIRL